MLSLAKLSRINFHTIPLYIYIYIYIYIQELTLKKIILGYQFYQPRQQMCVLALGKTWQFIMTVIQTCVWCFNITQKLHNAQMYNCDVLYSLDEITRRIFKSFVFLVVGQCKKDDLIIGNIIETFIIKYSIGDRLF